MAGKIVMIDGHNIVHRAFYGVPDLTNSEGMHTNAVYGFLNILFRILELEKPDYLLVAFDESTPTFRHEMFSEYKGTRKRMPDELREQIPVLVEVLQAMGVCLVRQAGIEADDILGTAAKRAEEQGVDVTIVSGDRDLLQLATEHIKISMPKTKKGGSEIEEYHAQQVVEKYQVTPAQIVDLKGLMGDASDNIPGVDGIGEKTAVKILTAFPTVEEAYEHLEEIMPKRARELLRAGKENAFLSKKLATIKTDCELGMVLEEARLGNLFTSEAYDWIKRLELKSLAKKFDSGIVSGATGIEQKVTVFTKKKEFSAFVNQLLAGQAELVGIAFLGDEWTNTGAKQKRKKKSGGQMSLVFDEDTGDMDIAEETAGEREFGFFGLSISVCCEGQCLTGCGFKRGELTGEFLVELCRKLVSSDIQIALSDWKNIMHLCAPVENLAVGKAAPCQALFPDETPDDRQILFGKVVDVKLGAYLLSPLVDSYEADDLAKDYLSLQLASREERFGKQTFDEVFVTAENDSAVEGELAAYLGELSFVACMSAPKILEELAGRGMERLFREVEIPTAYYLYQMERVGVEADRSVLEEMSGLLSKRVEMLEADIFDLAGEEFNINSPKQLGVILFEKMKLPFAKKTKTGYSTSADILEKLRPQDPIIDKILEYRQVSKLKSTYADGLPVFIEGDGRIHGKFNQTITATGRISSTEPNLQNIPIRMELGRQLRRVFRPREGCVFLDADYSQIELRVLAHMSGDSELIEAYREGRDIHRSTAARVFHTPFDEVTPLQRRNAKAVNFGIVYGISAFGLAQDLNVSKKEAQDIIDQYFSMYPAIKAFLDGMVADAKKNGYAQTLFGRRRPVPELASRNFMQRSFGERVAMNSPIQGTAADIIKVAMIRVAGRLKRENLLARIVLQVHDELLLEVPLDEVEQVRKLLLEEMPAAAELSVPLLAEVEQGSDWYEAH